MGNRRSAAGLLRAYLKRSVLKQSQFADQLAAARGGVVRAASVNQWLRCKRVPREEMRELIESATGGVVPASSWTAASRRRV